MNTKVYVLLLLNECFLITNFGHNESGEHSWDDETKGNIGDLKILKEQYPHLKILISIGGWTRSQNLPAIAESSNARLTCCGQGYIILIVN